MAKETCRDCGADMVMTGSGFTRATRPRRVPGPDGEVTVFWECSDPDCSGKKSVSVAPTPGQ